jgi:four helix bundle protein
MNQNNNYTSSLPHHRLVAYQRALSLLAAVRAADIRDSRLRDEALRAAKGACLNGPSTIPRRHVAEAAGRASRSDKARVFAIARGECVEAVAATEIAFASGDAKAIAVAAVVQLGDELCRILGALIR